VPVTDAPQTLQIPAALLPADGRFGCGPSRVRDAQIEALVAVSRSVLGTSHRQRPVKALVGSVKQHLASLLGAPDGYEVVLGNGGSTAFWDAAAFGLIEHRSAHGTWGEFGSKFAKAARAPWLAAPAVTEAPAGTRADVEVVEDADVYAWPHNETSTGVAAPVRRIAAPGALTVIDATSAAGGIAFDAAEADVYYFAPQKNLGSDGGLWAALVSPAAIERIERIAGSDRYIPEFLSLGAALENSRLDQTLNTPALSTLVLLESQLQWMNEQGGLAWAAERAATSSGLLYDWAERVDYAAPFVADPAHRSPVVVTIDFDGVDAAAIAKTLRANGVVDTEPYRKLGRNQLRIGTFASVEPADVSALIACIEHVVAATR
jgi:phosphoserine aminotransferase